jgi:subtilisin family serine protease
MTMRERFLPRQFTLPSTLPEDVLGYVAVRSRTGASVLDADAPTTSEPYWSSPEELAAAASACAACGLTIQEESQLGLAAVGKPEAWQELTGADMVSVERLVTVGAGRERYVTTFDLEGAGQPGDLGIGVATSEAARIDAVVLERPQVAMAMFPSPIPPPVSRYHLRVPDDVALFLGARDAHRRGHVGADVTVAMIDTGQYAHPYFLAHQYDVRPARASVPGMNPAKDPRGHGTGESANLFAVAPGVTLRPFRASNEKGDLVGTLSAFVLAKAGRPDVITNSWGFELRYPPQGAMDAGSRSLALEIMSAVEQGSVVVFSAGNGQFSVEPQVPGVISAGGAYIAEDMTLQASDYASAYESPWYRGVGVPTVCGLVGLQPRASYLMLPVPPGCPIDEDRAIARDGDPPDGTAAQDGWALFSGTSAAAPQVAGVAALVLGTRRGHAPAAVRQILEDTAVDVQRGRSNPVFGHAATAGRDIATGAGLVNAWAAVRAAAAS